MVRYKLVIEYDGSCFFGFQRQHHHKTVQGCIEHAILNMTQENVIVHGAGRTDTGVHALGQVVHFDLEKNYLPYQIRDGLNFYLASLGISILCATIVADTFHARFKAIKRHYTYKILNRRSPSPLVHSRAWHVKKNLDQSAMAEAAHYFIGQHDFSSFRCKKCQSPSPVRTVDSCIITNDKDFILFHVSAKSFLHNQIRIMIGSLVQVGYGKYPPYWIADLLKTPERTLAGPTAPPHGLYFTHVDYA